MGHERVGILPKSKRWRTLVSELASALDGETATVGIAERTLSHVRERFDRIHEDLGVQTAFSFLLALTSEAELSPVGRELDLAENPSAIRLIAELSVAVRANVSSHEYAEIARSAAADAIAYWTQEQMQQEDLFSPEYDASLIWGAARSGAAFTEITRVFFSSFVERYLRYFLEREASAVAPSLQHREEFDRRLSDEMREISHHAFETTKITQSFAAGWYNRHVKAGTLSDEQVVGFLSFAFSKLRQELQREAVA